MTVERRFRDLLRHAWHRSHFYRAHYARHGIAEADLAHIALHDLPVVSKNEIMAGFDDAVTDPRLRLANLRAWVQRDKNPLHRYLDEYYVVHSSAGSSISSFVPYTPREWRRMASAAAARLLPSPQERAAPLRSAFYFGGAGHFASTTNAALASRAAHEVLLLLGTDPVEEVTARINTFQPQRLHSYSSTMRLLADWTLSGALRIRPGSVVVTGDRLTAAARARIREAWGAQIYELYAAVESLFAAVRGPESLAYDVASDLNIVEVVGPDLRMVGPGERGRVLLTGLTQVTLPLIRFALDDWATLGDGDACARTLASLDGKTHTFLPARRQDGQSGRLESFALHGLELPGVDQVQIVSHGPDEAEIRYRAPVDRADALRAALSRALADHALHITRVAVRRVERIANDSETFKCFEVTRPERKPLVIPSFAHSPGPAPIVPGASRRDAAPAASVGTARSVVEAFDQAAALHPHAIAVADEMSSMTYGELAGEARHVARWLLASGADLRRPVAVHASHGAAAFPLILGCLYAGGLFLVLDPAASSERLRAALAEIRPGALLTDAAAAPAGGALPPQPIPVLAGDAARAIGTDVPTLPVIAPEALACLLYTSGTTGVPKGVALSHRAVLERARRYVEDCGLSPGDRVALLPSPAVNAGIREAFGALLAGARLAIYDLRARGTHPLARWLEHERISVFYTIPSVWRALLEALDGERFPDLRLVRLGGEPVTAADVAGFQARVPRGCVLVNGYAASETGTICLELFDHDTRLVAGRVPVGRPAPGVEVFIRGENGERVTDAVGEIVIRGDALASGIWDAVEGRVRPFAPDGCATGDLGYGLADGRVLLTGRRGLWFKAHGQRIHLGEVEAAVLGVPGIENAAAVVDGEAPDGSTLVVFYTARAGAQVLESRLRDAVSASLPGALVAVAFQRVSALPRRPGGKLNREMLLQHRRPDSPQPQPWPAYIDAIEAQLASIWAAVLNRAPIARDADFIDLGGDSLSIFRAVHRIHEEFAVSLSLEQFLEASTLATQATLLRGLVPARHSARA